MIGLVGPVVLVGLALVPVSRRWPAGVVRSVVTIAPIDLPIQFSALILLTIAPDLVAVDVRTVAGALQLVTAAMLALAMAELLRRSCRSRPALGRALADAFEDDAQRTTDAPGHHRPWIRLLLMPWPWRPRQIERHADIAYGPDEHDHRLDLYRRRGSASSRQVLVHLHPGGFRWGRRSRESRWLLFHLARHGWITISADYHLDREPAVAFPRQVVDVKRVIAWIRTTGPADGVVEADPTIVLVGGSAGAHLAIMAALTANDATLQPGFADVDTAVAGVVGLYGYYGPLDGLDDRGPTSPLGLDAIAAPPVLLVHGTHDSVTPLPGARRMRDHLALRSAQPVALAELPGAQHSFDLFTSIRYVAVVDSIREFAERVDRRRFVPGRER